MSRRLISLASVMAILQIVMMVAGDAEAKIIENGLVHYWSFDNVDNNEVPDLAGNNDVELVEGKTPPLLGGGQSNPKNYRR